MLKTTTTLFAAACLLFPAPALAIGKAGLWRTTVTMSMPGMPQMPQLTEAQRAQMQRMGMSMPNMAQPQSGQYCLTPEEAAGNVPPRAVQGCEVRNQSVSGATLTADMTCTGEIQGEGTVRLTYDTDEHYTGAMEFQGVRSGVPVNMTMSMEGNWQSADCGTVR